jgi:DNA-binding NarL/FixJ family response regulator
MIKVIIADDHTIFRQGLAQLLGGVEDISVTGEAADGQEAWKLICEMQPDIAILDLSMPSGGMEVAHKVRSQGLATKILLLTMHNEPDAASKALQTGAHAYVLKDNAFEDLIYALRSVARGGTFISPSLMTGVLKAGERRKENEPLTRREREVLALIATGLTNRQTAEKLFISIKTVETHRARIMQALDLHTTAELVRYAIENGLLESRRD